MPGPAVTGSYEIRTMTPDDVEKAMDSARAEGWNPGLNDARCFRAVDPGGFIGGYLDGELVASISAVNYDGAFAFLGCYIVAPPHRGKGYGIALWRAAVSHAEGRLLGLDGVPAQVANYQRSGFRLAYRNVRYGGPIDEPVGPLPHGHRLVPARDVAFADLAAYDRTCFPAARDGFLRAWTAAAGHRSVAYVAGDSVAGYGVLRPCHLGAKIGPLFADDERVARAVVAALTAGTGPDPVYLDVPEVNPAAVSLAQSLSLAPVFETARMYTGPPPAIALDRVFGVSTFELG